MKIGDLVIFKDQTKMLYKGALMGGVIMLIDDTFVILDRHGRAPTSYNTDEIRLLEPTDIPERGVEIR